MKPSLYCGDSCQVRLVYKNHFSTQAVGKRGKENKILVKPKY